MKLVVGLGNPGIEYKDTRHNIGFMFVDEIANYYDIKIDKKKFSGLYRELRIASEKVILLKPQKFMNLSGEVIKKFVDYFKIDIEDILIICDDMDLPTGRYKLKNKGRTAGHNGLKNIELHLNTNEYKRLKIGISRDNEISSADYVLGRPEKEDEQSIKDIISKGPFIINDFLTFPFDKLMSKHNYQDTK